MEIKIEYADGGTFITQIPTGRIESIMMCLSNQHPVKTISNFDISRCDEPKDRFTCEDAIRGRRTPV